MSFEVINSYARLDNTIWYGILKIKRKVVGEI